VRASVSAGGAATSTHVRSCPRATPDQTKSATAVVKPHHAAELRRARMARR
jgi:hypothetical protein